MTRRIAIDARKLDDFGIGTTIRGILQGLESTAPDDVEIMVLGPETVRERVPATDLFEFAQLDVPHYSLREIFQVGRRAEELGADLLHVPHYVTPRTSLPLVTTIHDLIHLRAPRSDLPLGGRAYARWMLARATTRSARVITVSNAVRNEIADRFPVATPKLRIVPNGVAEHGLPIVPASDRQPFLLFVGNDKPHKNVDRLVEAFTRIRKDHPRLALVLVGASFDRFRETAGIDARGFVEESELIGLYRTTTALVQPSRFEGFGLPVVEAMAHGTPVIVSAIPPLLEVTDGQAVTIDDPLDVSSIVRALSSVIEDDSLRDRLSHSGPSTSSRYRWSTSARTLVEIWKEVLD